MPAYSQHDDPAESYRRLADVFHDLLAEESLDAVLSRIASALADLVPHDSITVYEADDSREELVPVFAHDQWAENILSTRIRFDEGITGWAASKREPVLCNQAHLDPRVKFVPGTPPDEAEALISIPLVARDQIKGALNIYRLGEGAFFADEEFELAKRFGDAAALALDNAHIRARLELQAQTDSLTGLFNHRTFHERLREALRRASRLHEPLAVLMFDIDDFKRVNDVHGHGVGDEILRVLADSLRGAVRGSDVVCRIGGEEFAVIMNGCSGASASRLAQRLVDRVGATDFGPVGRVTISLGVAQGPEHAMNPRELVACAEAAMMTAKARGKNGIVFYGEESLERPAPTPASSARDMRSIAHMKLLQSLAGKLSRLNDTREIGDVIAEELRSLIDYHNCRVCVVEGDDVIPIAFRGGFTSAHTSVDALRCKVGEGVTGRAALTGESLLIGDAANCEFARVLPGTELIEETLLAVPLNYGKRVIGIVVLSKLGLDQFDEDDVRLLEVLAGHAAVALENARLYEAERRESDGAKALLEFSRELASAQGLEETLDRVVELSAHILGSRRTSVWIEDNEGFVVPRALWGYDEEARSHVLLQRAPAAALAGEREARVIGESDVTGVDVQITGGARFAVAPLNLDGRVGCIAAQLPETNEEGFEERELRLLAGIAHQAKLAIANATSFESLEETFLSTVEALANALEANDEYTSSHARWITDLALQVGERLGLHGTALKRLELGALFHDIGKLGIPQGILSKPGPLTDEERATMETHPALGERIISPIERLADVRPIVRHCHERWDGAGYPDRRAGEEIPLESRIIFVCDAFHAMTTDRPYRDALPAEEACRRLEQAAGTQFDARVVAACLRVLDDRGVAAAG